MGDSSELKDARALILTKVHNALTKAVNDNLSKPEKLEEMLGKALGELRKLNFIDNADIINERLKLTRVNKHVIFSALDEAIKVIKEEAGIEP